MVCNEQVKILNNGLLSHMYVRRATQHMDQEGTKLTELYCVSAKDKMFSTKGKRKMPLSVCAFLLDDNFRRSIWRMTLS